MVSYVSISVAKAEPSVTGEPTRKGTIVINEKVPDFASLSEAADYYEEQAQMIERVLYGTLPGGTYDRLLGALLRRKASHFRVAHGE
jgi:hypothetical protein